MIDDKTHTLNVCLLATLYDYMVREVGKDNIIPKLFGKKLTRAKPDEECVDYVEVDAKGNFVIHNGIREYASPLPPKNPDKYNLCKELSPDMFITFFENENLSDITRQLIDEVYYNKKGCVKNSKLRLKSHQENAIEFLSTHRGMVAAFGTGSGKTLLGVTASQCFLEDHPNGKIKVVTPTSLQLNFKKEMKAYGIDSDDSRYEFFTIAKFANEYGGVGTHNLTEINKETMLIIDEAHVLRTEVDTRISIAAKHKTPKKGRKQRKKLTVKRVAVFLNACKRAGKVLLMTATPIYNKPFDINNLVAMVKGTNPLSESDFEDILSSDTRFDKYFKDVFYFYETPLDENYPTYRDHIIRLKMNKEYYEAYRTIEKRDENVLNIANPFVFLVGLRQSTNALSPCIKCDWIMDKVKEGKKTVIFSSFLDRGVGVLKDDLKRSNIKYVEITGSMNQVARDKAVKKYNDIDGDVNVMLITKAGSEGLDLKGTRYVIHVEKGWTPELERQVNGRAVRYRSHVHLPENERHVDIYYLILEKPSKSKREASDLGPKAKESADHILDDLVKDKIEDRDNMLTRLYKISIDRKYRK